jgi:pimeloyl-ACP methyl ester carboxylesterase
MKLSYTRSGNPNSDAMIFLHGNAMGQWKWVEQTKHFADYDCYNVDLPGHDASNQIALDKMLLVEIKLREEE